MSWRCRECGVFGEPDDGCVNGCDRKADPQPTESAQDKDPEMVILALSVDMDEPKGNMLRQALHAVGAKMRALEADNAEVVRAARAMHDEVAEGSLSFAKREAPRHELLSIIEQPHPGAALLAEHSTELEAERSRWRAELASQQREWRKALESQQAECHTLRRAFLHERHRADAAGAPPEHAYNMRWAENLLADERKALAEARNAGLERAAVACLTQRDRLHAANMTIRFGTRLGGLEEAASIARNLKEKT